MTDVQRGKLRDIYDTARNNDKNEYIKSVKQFVTIIKKLDKRMQKGAAKEEEERKIERKTTKGNA